ncbi:hypothetical protein [Vibrio sp. 10N]|uniref:hypothetical protein n=1 Tax=Vibrio sp. 10N TaxID=3058938 RepID=UPI002812A4BE|nr:hypothetical protein VB10N_15560 [Vibrio sp. 10N]
MKWVCMVALCISNSAFAGSATGGTPTVPCWLKGDYQGNMLVTQCWKMGGLPNKKRSLEN